MSDSSTPLIIVNPIAGNGRAHGLAPRITRWLDERNVDARVTETRERGHAERLAVAAGDLGHDRVVVVGGDGTIQEVVNGLLGASAHRAARRSSLGLVPGGSGNDMVRDLELPLDPMSALVLALGAQTRAIDVARAEDADGRVRLFPVAGGVGFDAQVAHAMFGHRMPWQKGRIGYFLSTFVELMRYRNRRLVLEIETPDGRVEIDRTCLLVAFANGAYYGGGMQICPGAELADGLIDVCVAGDLSRRAALRLLPGIYRGAHVGHPKVEFFRASALRVSSEDTALVHLDGEPFGSLPVRITIEPGALDVAVGDSGTLSA